MKFFLVSASNPTVKEEVDIPDEIVVRSKKPKKQIPRQPRSNKNLKRKKAIQSSKPVIEKHRRAVYYSNKWTRKSK